MEKAEESLSKILERLECPKCGHCYGYVYDDENDNNNQRSVGSCGCACGWVAVPVGETSLATESAPVATRGGPVPPPGRGQLPRTSEHHPELCNKDCTECVSKKPAPATFDGEGNSSVSAAPSLADIALSKGQRPLDPDSSDPLSKWTCKHGMCILPNPTGRHNAYTWNGVSHEYGNGRYRVCKACYVEKHPSDPEEKKRLTLSGSF